MKKWNEEISSLTNKQPLQQLSYKHIFVVLREKGEIHQDKSSSHPMKIIAVL